MYITYTLYVCVSLSLSLYIYIYIHVYIIYVYIDCPFRHGPEKLGDASSQALYLETKTTT